HPAPSDTDEDGTEDEHELDPEHCHDEPPFLPWAGRVRWSPVSFCRGKSMNNAKEMRVCNCATAKDIFWAKVF
ncbi:MAG TPA: hypothetical protein VIU40_07485, partial [Geobacteraceae bacterium]